MNNPHISFDFSDIVDFEHWAIRRDPFWHHAMRTYALGSWSREEAFFHIAKTKTLELIEARKRIEQLEAIAPKRIKGPDGCEYIWHCPNELIPLDNSLQNGENKG